MARHGTPIATSEKGCEYPHPLRNNPHGALTLERQLERGGVTMASAIVFEVVTKAGLLLAGIVGLICWVNAGCPFVTISRK